MREETFSRRMEYLRKHGYTILPLQRASGLLRLGGLPDRVVVVTVDDGFYSVFRCALPILNEHSIPATVYVTSYYSAKESPIFRLAVQYIFWKTGRRSLDFSGLGFTFGSLPASASESERNRALWEIIRFGEAECDEATRCELVRELAERAGLDSSELFCGRRFSLMNQEEIRHLSVAGIDIQLHTHRHCLPADERLVTREITDNRRFLEPLTRNHLQHFCYPSGVWSRQHWPWLRRLGIKTATTCDPGLNYTDTPELGLRRFLDGEDVSSIEFEAELSGFSELLRSLRLIARRAYARPID